MDAKTNTFGSFLESFRLSQRRAASPGQGSVSNEDLVLKALSDAGEAGTTIPELIDATHLPPSGVLHALEKLTDFGLASRIDLGETHIVKPTAVGLESAERLKERA